MGLETKMEVVSALKELAEQYSTVNELLTRMRAEINASQKKYNSLSAN